jgi:hypothetical protein
MGLSHFGDNFQMNGKKLPSDAHCIIDQLGERICMDIREWILKEPEMLWRDMYSPGGSQRVQLCSNSLKLLTDRILQVAPALYAERQKRKRQQRLIAELKKRIG